MAAMKTVHAKVYGKDYTLACDTGQEQHLMQLVRQVDARAERLDQAVGNLRDDLMLLYVALMIADELHDAQKENTRLRAELDSAQRLSEAGSDDKRLAVLEEEVAGNLNELAERLGALTGKLQAA
jgi:cell division protein ZapA